MSTDSLDRFTTDLEDDGVIIARSEEDLKQMIEPPPGEDITDQPGISADDQKKT